jgi:hypothetical protein
MVELSSESMVDHLLGFIFIFATKQMGATPMCMWLRASYHDRAAGGGL